MERIVGYVKTHTVAPVLTKAQQHEALEEEIRQRMIKAQKISYWRQFQQGLLGRDAARILIALADNVLSDPGRYAYHNVDFLLNQSSYLPTDFYALMISNFTGKCHI